MSNLAVPVLMITVGVGWLLTTLGIIPNVDWVWTLGLAVTGILAFILGGWNKFSVVVGPMLLLASAFSLLRQTGRMSMDHEIPMLTIALGVLLLVARSNSIPTPEWIQSPPRE